MFQGPKGYIAQICEVCSMETVQQNGRFTLFSSEFHSNIYSILFVYKLVSDYRFTINQRKAFLMKASLDFYVNLLYVKTKIDSCLHCFDIIAYHCMYMLKIYASLFYSL